MLVLSRKRGEFIRIGDDVRVVVVDIRGDKVRIGIEAPDDVVIDRDEVRKAKEKTSLISAPSEDKGFHGKHGRHGKLERKETVS